MDLILYNCMVLYLEYSKLFLSSSIKWLFILIESLWIFASSLTLWRLNRRWIWKKLLFYETKIDNPKEPDFGWTFLINYILMDFQEKVGTESVDLQNSNLHNSMIAKNFK